jgi:N-acetylneuraminate synthase
MQHAKSRGLVCFSSPFDASAVDFLESLDVPAYKIASFECIDLPLIRKVAQTGKPMIISTGMATIAEIDDAVRTARENGCKDLVLLKCTSTYPASPENTHVRTIPHMHELFGCATGLSDHTMGLGASVAATALGAVVIEKHFTLRRADGGVDAAFSLEPEELKQLVIETERAWLSLGGVHYGPTETEVLGRTRRRSLYIVADMQKGDLLTADNLRAIRPGLGLPPKFQDIVLGMRVSQNISAGTPLSWSLLKE